MGLVLLILIAVIEVAFGSSLRPYKEPPRCGNWIPYKDEKCLKIVETTGFQTQQDAEIVCESFSAELNRESYPRLIRIKTQEEQAFLHQFLFTKNNIVDHVWLGLTQNETSEEFKWNDGTDILYSNWANQNVTDDQHKCVQMESGGGVYPVGQWVRVHCQKRNSVVCERTQTWTLETLQNILLNLRQVHEVELRNLKNNPVPLKFIYVQLPGQDAPTTIWPQVIWSDVSSSYQGLFFRVIGGSAAPFGEIQASSTSHLEEVETFYQKDKGFPWKIALPSDGSWSQYIGTNLDNGGPHNWGHRFHLAKKEIRPRNQAVKIWQRSG